MALLQILTQNVLVIVNYFVNIITKCLVFVLEKLKIVGCLNINY